jgi:hypothetical protein|nr:hypothetical protein [uncultured Lachnoclostridium sp.]
MNDLCEFMQYRDDEDSMCTSPSCSECDIYKALDKHVPKKIDRVGNKCPVCKCYLASQPIPDHYCFNCGQAIDWSEEE